MDQQRYLINGRIFAAQDPLLQEVLARVHGTPVRPRCLCIAEGVVMYVSKFKDFVIKRMPELPLMETCEPLETLLPRMVSANAYLGADTVKAALDTGADVVLTGRVADQSLFLGTVMHHFDWDYEEWPRLAAGTVAGHLLECSGSVTGSCFAWANKKEVEGLARPGFPLAEVGADGNTGSRDSSGILLHASTCRGSHSIRFGAKPEAPRGSLDYRLALKAASPATRHSTT